MCFHGVKKYINTLMNFTDLLGVRTLRIDREYIPCHYIDVIMTTVASQITSLTIVYSSVYSATDQRKHQSSASLAIVWGIHRDRWIPRTNGQLRGKCFHLMTSSCQGHNSVGLRQVIKWGWVCLAYATILHHATRRDRDIGIMMTLSNGNIFRVTGHLCGEFTGHLWIPLKGQWRGALMCSVICAWIKGWLNNREAGDLRRHRAHYDVTAMGIAILLRSVSVSNLELSVIHDANVSNLVTWKFYTEHDGFTVTLWAKFLIGQPNDYKIRFRKIYVWDRFNIRHIIISKAWDRCSAIPNRGEIW